MSVRPMLAKRGTPPEGPQWVYEPKWNGFRVIADSDGRLMSRHQKPMSQQFPDIVLDLTELPPGTTLDCELIIFRGGSTSLRAVQSRRSSTIAARTLAHLSPAHLVVFDVLSYLGESLMSEPFGARRNLLKDLIKPLSSRWILTPQTDDIEMARLWFDAFQKMGCDGIMCKRLDERYHQNSRNRWIKWKPEIP